MQRAVMLIAILAIVMFGCSDDPSTEPEPPVEMPLAEVTIGSSGGTLETDDFVLIVPSGAFGSSFILKLYESEVDFSGESSSGSVRLEGFPASFADSVTVRMRNDGAAAAETYIAVGSQQTVFTDQLDLVEEVVFELLPAIASADFLEAKLPPQEAAPLRGVAPTILFGIFFSVAPDREIWLCDHIEINFHKRFTPHIEELLAYFEDAYELAVDLGIGYVGRTWSWPAKAIIKDHPAPNRLGSILPRRDKAPAIVIDQDDLNASNLEKYRPWAIKGMLFAGAILPDMDLLIEDDRIWWHRAVIEWATMQYGGSQAPTVPEDVLGNEAAAFAGLPYEVTDFNEAEGLIPAWTAIADLLVEKYGHGLIRGIYTRIKEGTHPTTALLAQIPDPEYAWWPDFVDRWVTGAYYDIDSSIFLAKIESNSTFRVRTKADSVKVFSDHCAQLSAKLHRIQLGYPEMSDEASMDLKLDTGELDPSYATLKVYKAKDGILTSVGDGHHVTIDSIRDLMISGYDVIPTVINCYTDEPPYSELTPIKLTMRIVGPVINYTGCRISLRLTGSFQVGEHDPYEDDWMPKWQAVGSTTENVFTGQIDTELHGETASGTVTATIDPLTKMVLSFHATASSADLSGSSTWLIRGSAIPKADEDPGHQLRCLVVGDGICGQISEFGYNWIPSMGDREDLTAYGCGDDAQIEIKFFMAN